MEEDNQLIEAIENVRRDKHQPIRYMVFTFFNGIAQGAGFGLGVTIVFGIAILILTQIVASMVNVPIIGHYFSDLGKIIEFYGKQAGKIR